VLSAVQTAEDGTISVILKSIEHEKKPPASTHVRGSLRVFGWVIKPLKEGGCKLTLISLVDLGGSIPGFALKKVASNQPVQAEVVRALAEAMDPRYYDLKLAAESKAAEAKAGAEGKEGKGKGDGSGGLEQISINRGLLDGKTVERHLLRGEQVLQYVLQQAVSVDWLPVSEEKGIRIYKRVMPGSSIHCFMGKGVIKSDARKIYDTLSDPNLRHHYDKMIVDLRVVRHLADGIAVVWAHYETRSCLAAAARDFCVLQVHRGPEAEITDGKFVCVSCSVKDPACPELPGIVRGDVVSSAWVIVPHAKNESHVSFIGQVDFKGSVPIALINTVGRRQPLMIYHLGEYMSELDKVG